MNQPITAMMTMPARPPHMATSSRDVCRLLGRRRSRCQQARLGLIRLLHERTKGRHGVFAARTRDFLSGFTEAACLVRRDVLLEERKALLHDGLHLARPGLLIRVVGCQLPERRQIVAGRLGRTVVGTDVGVLPRQQVAALERLRARHVEQEPGEGFANLLGMRHPGVVGDQAADRPVGRSGDRAEHQPGNSEGDSQPPAESPVC